MPVFLKGSSPEHFIGLIDQTAFRIQSWRYRIVAAVTVKYITDATLFGSRHLCRCTVCLLPQLQVDLERLNNNQSRVSKQLVNKQAINKQLLLRVKTPCIGVCSTGIGDSVCRGCKRFSHEVIHWNSYSEAQKRLIDQRLEGFLVQIVESKLQIFDRQLLRWHLEQQQISYSEHKNPYIWAYELLRAGASQLGDLTAFGLSLDAQYRDSDLRELRLAIDAEFYILSEAHHQRYFRVDSQRCSTDFNAIENR